MPRLCFYVTGHGFGHASRVQAVLEEFLRVHPDWSLEVRTAAPLRAFAGLDPAVVHSALEIDPGVIQRDSFAHDLEATTEAWLSLLTRAPAIIAAESARLRSAGVDVVLSDVSPLACAIARAADLPCLLQGNFTWDWILEGYLDRQPRLAAVIETLRRWYALADVYLRLPLSPETKIFGRVQPIGFVARRTLLSREALRAQLGIGDREKLVLLSFGGFGASDLDVSCVRGTAARGVRCAWEQPQASPPDLLSIAGLGLRYTDLIAAADVAVSKPGFGIIAEAVAQETPLVWVPRGDFREAPLLEAFLLHDFPSTRIEAAALGDGRWLAAAEQAAHGPRPQTACRADGAVEVREAIEQALR